MHRVLIVSDERFLQRLVGFALTGLDAEMHYAEGADEAERHCRHTLFDLVLILETAPFLSGRSLIERIRPAGLRRPAVYVVTWQQAEQTVLSLLECGVDQYLTFPVSLARLRNKVAEGLAHP